jgi:CRP/FNR family transcriptional regulator, cyclic AMP receptor protein
LCTIYDGSTRLKIAERVNERSFPKGTLIFSEGDPGHAFYVIVDGRVKVFVTSAGGDEVVLATVGPPEVLGSVAMLDGGARSASAEALDHVTSTSPGTPSADFPQPLVVSCSGSS